MASAELRTVATPVHSDCTRTAAEAAHAATGRRGHGTGARDTTTTAATAELGLVEHFAFHTVERSNGKRPQGVRERSHERDDHDDTPEADHGLHFRLQ